MDSVTRRDAYTADTPTQTGVTLSPAPAAPPPRRRLVVFFDVVGATLAWLVIIGVASFLVYRNAVRTQAAPAEGAAWLVGVETRGRSLVGAAPLSETPPKPTPAAAAQNRQQFAAAAKG